MPVRLSQILLTATALSLYLVDTAGATNIRVSDATFKRGITPTATVL